MVQLGQNRAGFYSYTLIENIFGFDMHNADRIVPQWQNLEKGDKIMLSCTGGMLVEDIKPGEYVVCDMPMSKKTSWAFYLQALTPGTTRLLARMRMSLWGDETLGLLMFDPGHFLMERRTLSVIKERAEHAAGIKSNFYFREALWGIAMLVGFLMISVVFFQSRQWPWNLLMAGFLTVLLECVLFFFHASIMAAISLTVISILAPFAMNYLDRLKKSKARVSR